MERKRAWPGFGSVRQQQSKAPCRPLGEALAQLQHLQKLVASFAIDAVHFFRAFPQDRNSGSCWENLTSLSLTSRCLCANASREHVEKLLLLAAGVAARHFPSLQMLEIWYGRRGQALLFRYRVMDGSVAEISWCGTRALVLRPHIVRAWALMSKRELRVVPGRIFSDSMVGSLGDAIYHLGLHPTVVHPQSLKQMRRGQPRMMESSGWENSELPTLQGEDEDE